MTIVSLPKHYRTLLELFLSICLLLAACTKKDEGAIVPNYPASFWIKGTVGESPLKWEQNKSNCRNTASSRLDTTTCSHDTVANQSFYFDIVPTTITTHTFHISLLKLLPADSNQRAQALDSVLREGSYRTYKCKDTTGYIINYYDDGQHWTTMAKDTGNLVITKIMDEWVPDSYDTTHKVVEGTYRGTLVDVRNYKRTRKVSLSFRTRAFSN